MANNKPSVNELQKKLARAEKTIARLEKSRAAQVKRKRFSFKGLDSIGIENSNELAQAYIASEQNYKNSIEASPLGIRIMTEDGRLIYANQAILDMTGYSTAEELAAVPRNELYTPESYQEHLERKRKRTLKEPVPLEYEISIQRPDGEIRHLLVFRREVIWGGEQQFMAMYQDITGSKRAQEALRESEEKFHSIVERSNDGIVFIKNGIVQYCNSKLMAMGDYKERDIVGKPFIEFVAPERRKTVFDVYKQRLAGEKAQERYELILLKKDGGKIFTEVSASLISHEQEIIDIAIVRDITERKKLEEAIEKEREEIKLILDTSSALIWYKDKNGKFLRVNRAFAEALNMSVIDLVGKTVYDLYPADIAQGMTNDDREVMVSAGPKLNIIEQYQSASGLRWVQTDKVPVLDKNGTPVAIIGLALDITDRKNAEEALANEAVRRRILIEQSRDGIVILDQDGAVYEANQRFVDMLGYTMAEMKNMHVFEWEFQYPRRQVIEMIRTVDEKGDHFETRHRRKDGTIFDVEISTNGAIFAGQKLIFCVCRDISGRKQMEKTLEESEVKYRSLIENTNDAIFLTIPDGTILSANTAATKMFGKSEEAIIRGGRDSLMDTSDPRLAQALETRKKTGEFSGELTFFRADGTKFPGYISSKIFLDKDGKEKTSMIVHDITARKQTEMALRESQEMFSMAFHNSPALYSISTLKEGRIIEVNDVYCRVTGYSREELIGHTTLGLHIWENSEERSLLVERLEKNQVVSNVDVKIRTKTGDIRTANVSMGKITLKNEPCLITIAVDITERRKAEESLKERELFLDNIIEKTPNALWISNDKGLIIRMNQALRELLYLKDEEVIGKYNVLQDKQVIEQGHLPLVKSVFEEGKTVSFTIDYYTQKEEQLKPARPVHRVLDITISAVKDASGKVTNAICQEKDITERQQAQDRINHLNQTLRSIRNVNQLITREKDREKLLKGVCDTLVESRNFYMTWIALFDESRYLITYAQSGMPDDFTPIVKLIRQGNWPTCVEKAYKKGQVIVIKDPGNCVGCTMFERSLNYGTMSVRLEYGDNIYGVLSTSLPKEVLADTDEISLFQEVANDIAFALYNIERQKELEQLEQERLRSAKLESIGTLAGGIAHDFNNLLTGIMGNIGMVKSSIASTDATYEMLDEAEKAAVRSKELTQQLLTFARGGKPIKKPVDIAALIKESATFSLRGSKAKQELELPDTLWYIEADEGQISQVINNLVINADEAMPVGGTLKIQAQNVTLKKTEVPLLPGGDYIRIDVSDTGIGITEEHLQRIFEPYFTTKQKGTGLGLTTAYSIVRNHGGTITADSVQNHGSTFHVYLPATKKTSKGGKKMAETSSGQAGGKVLVMDDEPMIRKMLQNMLTLGGYGVELSADGAEALEKYQAAQKAGDPFDAVIMDLTIQGGMGGQEAVKKLLEIDPNATAIVSSGYATDPIMSEFKKYGFRAVIAKPYSVKQLQETLSGVITKKKK